MVAQQADSSLVHFLDNISYRPRVGPSPSPVLKNYVSNLEMDLDWPVIPIHWGIWNGKKENIGTSLYILIVVQQTK